MSGLKIYDDLVNSPENSASNNQMDGRIRKLEERLKRLDKKIGSITQGGKNEQQLFIGMAIQEQILNNKLIKSLLIALAFVIGLGIAIWLGGITYGAFQIESFKSRAEAMQSEINESKEAIAQMQSNYQAQLDQSKKDVMAESSAAIDSIKKEKDQAVIVIREERVEKENTILQSEDPRGYYRIEAGATWFYVIIGVNVAAFVLALAAVILSIIDLRRMPKKF